jgi:hypothetical protein
MVKLREEKWTPAQLKRADLFEHERKQGVRLAL